jgi:hypothetical protein
MFHDFKYASPPIVTTLCFGMVLLNHVNERRICIRHQFLTRVSYSSQHRFLWSSLAQQTVSRRGVACETEHRNEEMTTVYTDSLRTRGMNGICVSRF